MTEKDDISKKMPTFAAPHAKHTSPNDYDQKTDQNEDEMH